MDTQPTIELLRPSKVDKIIKCEFAHLLQYNPGVNGPQINEKPLYPVYH